VPFSEIRREYIRSEFDETHVLADPLDQFRRWFEEASLASPELEPTAMTLATATPDGRPSARMVLLKGLDRGGFAFYTNRRSRKGRELEQNPRAALVFHWPAIERQVRVEGTVERLTDAESDAYFASRPPGARLSATASPQSEVVADRAALEERVAALRTRVGDAPADRPEHWGGYRLVPQVIEFWQGRPDRLHDRLVYTLSATGAWSLARLAP
jgi:pyridoxamine 5'-phosphate oxidase